MEKELAGMPGLLAAVGRYRGPTDGVDCDQCGESMNAALCDTGGFEITDAATDEVFVVCSMKCSLALVDTIAAKTEREP